MAIKTIQPWEPVPVSQAVIVIYGTPGTGKTTLASSASNPYLLDFDNGGRRAGRAMPMAAIRRWPDVAQLNAGDLAEYDTIVVDTLGKCQRAMMQQLIANNPRYLRGGVFTQQGYGALKTMFETWLDTIKSMGKDVVLLSHTKEETRGDDTVHRLVMVGSGVNEVYSTADTMGELTYDHRGRVLNFNPTETSFGKNPAMLPTQSLPGLDEIDGCLSGIIDAVKAKLSAPDPRYAEQANQEAEALESYRANLEEKDLAGFNETRLQLVASKNLGPTKMRNRAELFKSVAESKGWKFDKMLGAYIDANVADAIAEGVAENAEAEVPA